VRPGRKCANLGVERALFAFHWPRASESERAGARRLHNACKSGALRHTAYIEKRVTSAAARTYIHHARMGRGCDSKNFGYCRPTGCKANCNRGELRVKLRIKDGALQNRTGATLAARVIRRLRPKGRRVMSTLGNFGFSHLSSDGGCISDDVSGACVTRAARVLQ
jgi:hypothetical protein